MSDYGTLTNNLIASNTADEDELLGALTLSYSWNFTDRLGTFIEYYGSESIDQDSDRQWQGAWDTGLGYLVNNNLLIDFSFGRDLSDDVDSSFVSAGFSYRL